MVNWKRPTSVIGVALAIVLGVGAPGAHAQDEQERPAVSVVATEEIGPWNSTLVSDDEVRQMMPIERMVEAQKTLKEIKRYFPDTTGADIVRIKRELASQPHTMISEVQCSLSTEFYGVLRLDGTQRCFAYAGMTATYINAVNYLCPGNNMGRTYYSTTSNEYYWSPWRGPVNPLTTCYHFSALVNVHTVQIA